MRLIAAAFFLTLLSAPAFALKVSPFKLTIVPSSSATQVIRVENNSDEPAAVQVSVETWRIDEEGREINQSAEKEFAIFPAQLVLGARESKAVRVQYLGPPVAVEKAYRLVAEQLPVRLKDTPQPETGVKFLLRFRAALYVSPGDVKSDIRVRAVEGAEKGVAVTLENTGSGHTLLRDPRLTVAMSDGRSVVLEGMALKEIEGQNIHAGGARRFTAALPPGEKGRPVSATFAYRKDY